MLTCKTRHWSSYEWNTTLMFWFRRISWVYNIAGVRRLVWKLDSQRFLAFRWTAWYTDRKSCRDRSNVLPDLAWAREMFRGRERRQREKNKREYKAIKGCWKKLNFQIIILAISQLLNSNHLFRQCTACLYIPQCLCVNATSTQARLAPGSCTCVHTAFYCVAVILLWVPGLMYL